MPQTPPIPEGDIQRWTAKRKVAVVLDLIRGNITIVDAARQHGLTVADIEQWKEDFLSQGTEALRSHPRDREAQWEVEKTRLQAKIGELAIEIDVLKKVHRILGKDLPDGIS